MKKQKQTLPANNNETISSTNKIYGKNAVLHCLESELSINKIWINEVQKDRFRDIENLARSKKIPVIPLDKIKLSKISEGEDHKSIIAEISPIRIHEEDFLYNNTDFRNIIIPVEVEDPHNLGAIIRSSYAFKMDAIALLNRRTVAVNSTVVSASAGAALSLPIVRIGNVVNTIEKLKKLGYWIYGTSVSNGENLYKLKFDTKSVILLGNEGKGLSDNILKHCDFRVHIPMEFESLNVSVAAGIILSKIYSDGI